MFALIDKLTKHNSFEKFVYKYFISNKNLKTQYKTVDEFTKYFALTDNDWNAFNTITKTDNVINTSFSKVEKSNLELKIKAVLARLYFNDEAFYKINNSTDTVVIKAINTLNSN